MVRIFKTKLGNINNFAILILLVVNESDSDEIGSKLKKRIFIMILCRLSILNFM